MIWFSVNQFHAFNKIYFLNKLIDKHNQFRRDLYIRVVLYNKYNTNIIYPHIQ